MEIKKIDEQEFITVLEKEEWLYLSTEANHHVTSRIVSHVNDGLKIYFYTNENSTKAKQLKVNPNIAINLKYYFIEGVVTNLGPVVADKNKELKTLYKNKFKGAFTNQDGTSSDDGDFYEIHITSIKQYIVTTTKNIGQDGPDDFAMTVY
ncbi:MAG: pyridoxamine 5'-phosphate oxidase family protein [Coprobacillaceae bacterium]